MPTPKKPLQKWKRRIRQEQAEIAAATYPHYHCLVCDSMIEKGEEYKTVQKSTGTTYTYYQFCSTKCYDRYTGKTEKKKSSKIWIFYLILPIIIIIVVVLLFTLS